MGRLLHALYTAQPLPTAASALAHYTGLAREAVLLQALREACAVIEDSARDAFFRQGMTQQEFERAWREDELQRWGQWSRLKTIAGLPHTQPELAGAVGDDFDIPDEPVADAHAADCAADLYQRDLDRTATQ